MLACISSSVLQGAQHKFRPFFDKFEDTKGTVYDFAPSPYTRITATKITRENNNTDTEYNYGAEYTLNPCQKNPNEINWVKMSAKDAQNTFFELDTKYQTYSAALHAHQKKKEEKKEKEKEEKVKMEVDRNRDTFMITTKYTQTKNGITRSAQRVLMPSGRKVFDSYVKGADYTLSSQELFEELAEMYRRENPA